jgi:hypothetical protein
VAGSYRVGFWVELYRSTGRFFLRKRKIGWKETVGIKLLDELNRKSKDVCVCALLFPIVYHGKSESHNPLTPRINTMDVCLSLKVDSL